MTVAAPREATPRDEPLVRKLLDAEPRSFDDALRLDLRAPHPDSAGFVLDGAYARVARSEAAPERWQLGFAGSQVAIAPLISAVTDHVARHGGGTVTAWRSAPTDDDDATLLGAGFVAAREQHQLRVALPIDATARWPAGVTVRDFEPALDSNPWLEVNNRAFAGHAEQGRWTAAMLAERVDEPWFDASLFVVAVERGRLIGFNWLKVHRATADEPMLGEIYVIGVDPDHHGRGLGKALALSGLDRLAARQITTAMLHVAADNDAAMALYRALGFELHHIDRAYERRVGPR